VKNRQALGAKEQFPRAPYRPAGANASNMQLTVARKNVVRNLRGFTLIELIVATAILVILTSLAIPLARVSIKRDKEHQLRRDLWDLRDAIDRYKDAAARFRLIP
jgi:prepilin-type N-terminal cleavage/methylation domain-containing protein